MTPPPTQRHLAAPHVTQNGSGTLGLDGGNTFTGAATVAQGTLAAANNSALGATNGGTTVASEATLEIVANAINWVRK